MVPTYDQLELMGVAQLTLTYNGLLTQLPGIDKKPLKKFETKAQGLKRTEELAVLARKQQATTTTTTTTTTTKPDGLGRRSITQVAQALIRAGEPNQRVWEALKDEFKLDESKKHYVSWNRAMMRRRGEKV